MENQEKEAKEPERFQDLTSARRRVWSSLKETQLFLRMLEGSRSDAMDSLLAACRPGDGGREDSIALRASIVVLDECINTIGDPS